MEMKTNKQKVSPMQKKKYRDLRFYILMMAIPVAQFCIMFIGVNFNNILLAFKEYDANMDYVWTLKQFQSVISGFFNNEYLQASLFNSIKFYFLTTFATLPPSLFISYYLYKKFFFHRQFKIILFLPAVIAGVVVVTCFYYLADRGYPLLVEMITGKDDALGLLVNSETRLYTLMGYNIFYGLAGNFLFYSSAMSGIDESISEAAEIDGANLLQEFWHITLPTIFPTLQTFLVSSVAGSLTGDYGMYAFSKTSGGSAVPTMGYFFTAGIMNDGEKNYPYYAALGLVLSVLTSIIVFTTRHFLDKKDPYNDAISEQNKRGGKRA